MGYVNRSITRITLLACLLILAGCAASNTPAQAIEAYIEALVAKNVNQLVNAACSDWEEGARQELRTFDAVTVSLQDLACQETSRQDGSAHVACQGKIVANYGNEILELDLAERAYLAVNEGGEWRMCGYP